MSRLYERFPILRERRAQAAGTLSGGEQQMLAISRALMSRPKLVMFDEPSLGLAPNIVERMFDIIRQIRAEGVTVIMVEQNAAAALELSDRSYVLEQGRVSLTGTGAALLDDPHVKNACTRAPKLCAELLAGTPRIASVWSGTLLPGLCVWCSMLGAPASMARAHISHSLTRLRWKVPSPAHYLSDAGNGQKLQPRTVLLTGRKPGLTSPGCAQRT